MKRVKKSELLQFTMDVLQSVGLDDFSLKAVGSSLVEASLRGVDSHGVRLLAHYADSAVTGRKNPKPEFVYEQKFAALGHLNADNAFGHAAGFKAIDWGIEMARSQGVGVVAVSNSSHPGAMASMTLRAAREGYLSFGFTNADSLILSFNSTRAYFGTNPICMAAPRENDEPFCLDMATSVVPWNRVKLHNATGKPLPDNVAVDGSGEVTNDAAVAAALLPTGSYKGYGLASMVEVLCGIYSGMAFGRAIPAMYSSSMTVPRKLAQFYIVLRSDGVVSSEAFMHCLQKMTNEVRSEPAVSEFSVMLPGDKEIMESHVRLANGIPLELDTVRDFKELGRKYSVNYDFLTR